MLSPSTSPAWALHPGDYVLAEPESSEMWRVLHRTPNEKEAERLIQEYAAQGRTVLVLVARGYVP